MPLSSAPQSTDFALVDRALGALVGGALGDALGMPTQTLSPSEIEATYGSVDSFVAPSDDHPVSRSLCAGAVTDDTEQTMLLAETLLASGAGFDDLKWVEALVCWEDDVRARGGYDLLGPSTKRAIDAIRTGKPATEAGRYGDTNGAAMRITPRPLGAADIADTDNRLPARVAKRIFAGNSISYLLDWHGGTLKVFAQNTGAAPFEEGAAVLLTWTTDSTLPLG